MLNSILSKTPFLILIFSSFNLNAQNYFGVQAGVNFANVSSTKDGSITNKLILGANGVVYFDFNLDKKRKYGIQSEFAFTQKGFVRESPHPFYGKTNTVYRLNYLDYSLLFKYKFGDKKGTRGYGILGPVIGSLLTGKTISRDDRERKNELDLQRWDEKTLGLIIGGGVVFPVRSVKFIIDLRYRIGLTSMNGTRYDSGTLRNRGINISVGYAFPLGARYYRP